MKFQLNKTTTQILIFIIAITLITVYHYFLQFMRSLYPNNIYVYIALLIILILCGYLIFNIYTQRSYEQHKQLSFFPLLLSFIMWGCFFAFPSLYSPYNWAWSFSNNVELSTVFILISKFLIFTGIVFTLYSMIRLGIFRTMGNTPVKLITDGPYKFTRNPQLSACSLIVVGYVLLRPSVFSFGWLLLFIIIANIMIQSEEKHLRNLFGDKFDIYCSVTNRWITFLN